MKVKICGITNPEDAQLCQSLGADFLGFIFYEKSSRYIAPKAAGAIISRLMPGPLKVGVFVNAAPEYINKIASGLKLDFAQLHGDEPAEDINKINIPVIKSFRVRAGFDFTSLKKYKTAYVLLDTYTDSHFGGTGKSFDRSLIPEEIKHNIFIAGGVSSENIRNIFKDTAPFAVDLSSSLELQPGKKDTIKVKRFFNILQKLQ